MKYLLASISSTFCNFDGGFPSHQLQVGENVKPIYGIAD